MTTQSGKTLWVIVGATGSGKTSASIEVAQLLGAEIVSTDSRQFYREIPIVTAQPTQQELEAVTHHLIANRSIEEDYNCGAYEVEALSTLEKLFERMDNVVAVGGSGLYIDALCEGLDELPEVSDQLRQSLRERVKTEGLEWALHELETLDPQYYEIVDKANPSRILRALELCISSGKKYSDLRSGTKQKRPFNIRKIGIDMPREELYNRINMRVEQMIKEGLEEEARKVYNFRTLNSLQTVGVREMFDYFDGTITFERAIELIQQNSRRYAKRQMTWFRRDTSIEWYPNAESLVESIKKAR